MNKLYLFLFTALVVFISGCERKVKIDGIYVDFAKIEIVKNQIQNGDQNTGLCIKSY